MEEINFNLLKNIERLLSPQPCLNLYVFDLNGQIIEDIRLQLINRLNVMFKRALGRYPGLTLEDAFLCGSSATYLWKDDSDFDIWVKIKIDHNKFFIKRPKQAKSFLQKQIKAYRWEHKALYGIGNHMLDIKICTSELKKMYGVYSLIKNRWIIKPEKDLTINQNKESIYYKTAKQKKEILQTMEKFTQKKTKGLQFSDVRKLMLYYNHVINNQYNGVEEYLITKLLRYEKTSLELRDFCYSELANYFSINAPEPRQD